MFLDVAHSLQCIVVDANSVKVFSLPFDISACISCVAESQKLLNQ